MKRTINSLLPGESVVFNIYNDILGRKSPIDGTVDFVDKERKFVSVSYLYGYQNRDAFIPYEDMLAVYNPNGDDMVFECISGKSDILVS